MRQTEAVPAGTGWIEKNIREFSGSPFENMASRWMLITAGNIENDKGAWNTMTASWGGLGVLWRKDIAIMFIRPSRRTFGFANDSPVFTLSFFDEDYRAALRLCGEKSGRGTDKAAEAGITPVYFNERAIKGAVSFKEARDIIICRKLYAHDFDPAAFIDAASIEECYHGKDYHRMFIGEVIGYRTR